MAQDVVVNGTTYPAVESVVLRDGNGNETQYYPDAVRYVEQTLTEAQKAQARQNLGIVELEPSDGDIPKIFFGGALQQTKDEAVVPFRYISKTDDFSGYAEIKAQGNSSMSYPKKNQTVKMFEDEACETKLKKDFKGWGKQNKYVFKANWIDLSHARNIVSARLWADVVKSRANYAELPELLRTTPNQGAVDGFPVKVYANGIYQGRYTINIPKDAWMANMDKDLDTHCILCGENYVSGCYRASANINESDWTDEIHDTVPASIKTRWNQVISFVMNSTDDEFRANLGNYFYVDSLIDYYLFGLASCGLDAFGKNQLYATYDGKKWIASMYDMDSTWGLYWNGSKFVPASYGRDEFEDYVNSTGNLLYVRLEQLFLPELQTRWAELKNGALSVENIINRFERFTDIVPADLVKEDYASTTAGGAFTNIPSKDTNNIQQIRSYALARQAWVDDYLEGASPVPEIEPVYELEAATTFTGSNFVDTGVKLYDTTKDWTILLEMGAAQTNNNAATMLHCIEENSPWPGVSVQYYASEACYVVGGSVGTNLASYTAGIPSTTTKIAIRCVGGAINQVAYYNAGAVTVKTPAATNLFTHDKNLLLGCYQKADGTKGRYWKGTISQCKVYFAALSDDAISDFLT